VSQTPPERPGRYQRSPSGLVAALIVTVLAVSAFVVFRAINRNDLQVRPERVDYLETVRVLQQDGAEPVYPARLPDGWVPTSVDLKPGLRLSWGVGIVVDDQNYVGVRQSSDSLGSLLETYVDEQPVEGDPATVESEVASRWRTFSDDGGDRAYAAEVAGQTVLVYGSAPDADLRTVIASLTRARL
jgi:hypothetical protein